MTELAEFVMMIGGVFGDMKVMNDYFAFVHNHYN